MQHVDNWEKENKKVQWICSDHGKEFKNQCFDEYFSKLRIFYEFSVAKTPQKKWCCREKKTNNSKNGSNYVECEQYW